MDKRVPSFRGSLKSLLWMLGFWFLLDLTSLMPEVRGSSQEEQHPVQGAVAMQTQEGREELLHVQGQERRP